MSGKRDSNSRPQPWQGCALPTELFPQNVKRMRLELTRHKLSLPPQSSASTNSAISPTRQKSVNFVPKTGLEPARLLTTRT